MPSPLLTPGTKKPAGRGRPPSRGPGLRIAGLPAPVLVGGVVLAVAIGLYIRHRSSTATAAGSTAAPALADTGASGGGSSSGSASGPDYTPFYSLADSINGLTGILGGGGTFQITNGGTLTTNTSPASGTQGSAPTLPAGSWIDPATGTNVNQAGYPTNTSYADLGLTPAGTIHGNPAPAYDPQALTAPAAPASLPYAPHSAATLVMPAQSAAQTAAVQHKETIAKNKAQAAAGGTHTSGL